MKRQLRCKLEVGDAVSTVETILLERPTHTISRLQDAVTIDTVDAFISECPDCGLLADPMRIGIEIRCPYCQNVLGIEAWKMDGS